MQLDYERSLLSTPTLSNDVPEFIFFYSLSSHKKDHLFVLPMTKQTTKAFATWFCSDVEF